MRQLSPAGAQAVADIARRHGFSAEAVATMLDAVANGGGGMAQFSHPEFGGSGQWMRSGMTMIGDMFNNALKARVDALCADLAALVAAQPGVVRSGGFQSQSQGGHTQQHAQQQASAPPAAASLFVAPSHGSAAGNWWGDDLVWPNSTGSQNNCRYAWFAQARRLAVDINGTVTIYDTLDHAIGGVSQQQSHGGSLTFTSQHGVVDVASLPVVSVNGAPAAAPPSGSDTATDIFAAIEKLAELHRRGILSDAEFSSKKAELLGRL
ncbi:SHOCT domain-containing protein [Rhodopila globiformis]|uniref:SHOCT domain-containing protein n=1 Tax=Rhodopila globiformis TaxID=1071 RepID=A0A2S6NIZ3_RHOGL|nr:SHOCT domain-containing protein [Rhodopila globiformis]PPQ34660.1 hypothetical protein CCS01_09985 [Rhodopila globiformis]